MQDFINIILMITFVGLLVWAIETLAPLPAQFKKAIYVVSVVFLFLYVFSMFGVLHVMPAYRFVR